MKKILLFLITLMASLLIFTSRIKLNSYVNIVSKINEEGINLAPNSKSAILIEAKTGKAIYSKNAKKKLAPASMTKIMTMILVMEKIDKGIIKLTDVVTTPKEAAGLGGSQIYLSEGEKMKVEDLLKSVAIASANDAALSLAIFVGGTEKTFVKMMNDKAKELNLVNTSFANPYGFDNVDHYSCSHDMGVMAAYLINNYEEILNYTSRYEDYVREDTDKRFWLVNTNKLVRFVDGVDGLKTGWTEASGYCLTATISKNNERFIAVAMGYNNPKERNSEVANMLLYATANYETYKIYKKGDIIKTIDNLNYSPSKFNICIDSDVVVLKNKTEELKEIKTKELIDEDNYTSGGEIEIYYDSDLLMTAKLYTVEEVKTASIWEILFEVLHELFLVS